MKTTKIMCHTIVLQVVVGVVVVGVENGKLRIQCWLFTIKWP